MTPTRSLQAATPPAQPPAPAQALPPEARLRALIHRIVAEYADWEHRYATMDPANEAGEIRAFKRVIERGFVYRGLKPVYWCFDCGSSLAEFEIEYADKKSQTLDVAFPCAEPDKLAAAFGLPEIVGEAMIRAGREAGRKLMIAYRIQYEPYSRTARALVRAGTFGQAKVLEASDLQNQSTEPQWRFNKELAGGGALPDIGIYCLNTARALTGEGPVEVFARIPRRAPVVVAEAVWQYSQQVLPGLVAHRGPILTVANWSGEWPGLVGLLNLHAVLRPRAVRTGRSPPRPGSPPPTPSPSPCAIRACRTCPP